MIRRVVLTGMLVVVLLIGLTGAVAAGGPVSGNGSLVAPVTGAQVTQGFGCTSLSFEPVDRTCQGGHFHSGLDLAAAAGTPIRATAGGTVTVRATAWGYGLHVILDHGDGLSSLYGHLSAVDVVSGDVVDAGDVIGAMGSTGNSTGPHLHFEIRRDGIPEDPRLDVTGI